MSVCLVIVIQKKKLRIVISIVLLGEGVGVRNKRV